MSIPYFTFLFLTWLHSKILASPRKWGSCRMVKGALSHPLSWAFACQPSRCNCQSCLASKYLKFCVALGDLIWRSWNDFSGAQYHFSRYTAKWQHHKTKFWTKRQARLTNLPAVLLAAPRAAIHDAGSCVSCSSLDVCDLTWWSMF